MNLRLNQSKEEIKIIIQHWIQILKIKLGWIYDFEKLIINYVKSFHLVTNIYLSCVNSIDYSTFDGGQFICSGLNNSTVRAWNMETNKQIRLFNGHLGIVYCVKFSQYHYYSSYNYIVCSSSYDKTIRFWDIKNNRQFVYAIEFLSFSGGRYLCSGSKDNTIRLWDIETSKSLSVFYGYISSVWCVDISPSQSNNNKSNNIGVIGERFAYGILKQLTTLKGHEQWIRCVKYGSNKLGISGCANTIFEVGGISNAICSGLLNNTIHFWDIRSNKKELSATGGNGILLNTLMTVCMALICAMAHSMAAFIFGNSIQQNFNEYIKYFYSKSTNMFFSFNILFERAYFILIFQLYKEFFM
ncbi:WD-40 repeat protein [Reticulomyxa filosa]|uniref:WD-40 repeat protein n=1 Tax=Reticulomyxa filosa TaxID=46433 RepID=X6MBY4_RETFI|nr:WD-40 repeat protein [Reticulomyxa filosa]|eukprot:ETO10942.1 WD-40 repeat protein [Reticulomyxa filosa]